VQEGFGGIDIKKEKVLMAGLKERHLIRMWGGGHDMLHVGGVAVFCHQTHTNVTLSSVSWCVSLCCLFKLQTNKNHKGLNQ